MKPTSNNKKSAEGKLVLIGGLLTLLIIGAFAVYAADHLNKNAKKDPGYQTTVAQGIEQRTQARKDITTAKVTLAPQPEEKEETIEEDAEDPLPSGSEEIKTPEVKIVIKLETKSVICKWNLDEKEGQIRLSLGTKAGSADVVDWIEADGDKFTFSPVRLNKNSKYFCNIQIGKEPDINSKPLSSEPASVEVATALSDTTQTN